MLAEIFPMQIRGFGMGVAVFVLWVANFAVSMLFPILTGAVGSTWTFIVFFLIGIASIVFTTTSLPETKGHTLESLEHEFRAKFA